MVPLLTLSLSPAGYGWGALSAHVFGPLVLARENNEVLSVWIWIYRQAGPIPEAAAVGVMLIALTALIGLAARKWVGESLSGMR
jgi:hypothetical protein